MTQGPITLARDTRGLPFPLTTTLEPNDPYTITNNVLFLARSADWANRIKSDAALQKAAIIGKPASPGATGGVWGATDGFTIAPEEEKKIDKAFREQSLAEGVVLGGTKYMGRTFLQDNLLHGVRTSAPRIAPAEELKIDKAFREQSLAEGVLLQGTKYMGRAFLQDNLLHGVRTSEPRSEGTLVWALNSCYVVAVFDIPTQAQTVIPAVNALVPSLGG
ncbi:unnamed protein product [Rhizoctonia solani]|uniref:Profilin n=1 Tax=Rhizoctonia solani TaxID=456999 RepID=A0A8H3DJ46_9AGAM|nr:unnamed protein product [Rhizoctonia solani]